MTVRITIEIDDVGAASVTSVQTEPGAGAARATAIDAGPAPAGLRAGGDEPLPAPADASASVAAADAVDAGPAPGAPLEPIAEEEVDLDDAGEDVDAAGGGAEG